MQPQPQTKDQQMQVRFDDKTLQGVYSNAAQVQFLKEEFIIDFMNQFPPIATLNARVIMSPGHAKRLAGVLANLVKQYESTHGTVEASQEPEAIGFKA
jgi:hypothetical protein